MVRPTAMRILMYRYLAEQKAAASLNDVESAFHKADRTTLYRTLRTFEDKGLVHQIDDGTGAQKYALCDPDCNCELNHDLHLHFHCHHCSQTVCLTGQKIPHITLPQGFVAEDANLVMKGICDKCSRV